MAIEPIVGDPTEPTLISLARSGGTFVVEASASAIAGALLPGSPGTGVEITIVCLSAYGVAVFPWGNDTIRLADLQSGDGNGGAASGCIVCSDGACSVRLRSVSGGWAVLGLVGVWEVRQSYSLAGPVRGSARGGYRQVAIPAAAMTGAGVPAAAPAADTRGLSYAAGADHDAPFHFVLPADWEFEGDITLHLTWCKTTSAAGAVKWQSRYRLGRPGLSALTAFSAWADVAAVVASDGDTAERVAVARFATVDMTAATEGTVALFEVRRLGTDGADTYAAAAVLIAVALQYQADGLGWRAAFAK